MSGCDYSVTNLELLKQMTEELKQPPFFESETVKLDTSLKRINSNDVIELKVNNEHGLFLFVKKGLIRLGSGTFELLEEGDVIFLTSKDTPYKIIGVTPAVVTMAKFN